MSKLMLKQEKYKISENVSKLEYFGYFSYGFGQCFSYGLVGSFILFFYTDILGISALIASTIFLVARALDAFADPMIAGFMDTRRTKEGKFKGYLKITPLFIFISTVLCFFSPQISLSGKILYAGITYVLWGILYSVSDIPFWSLSAVISNKPQERSKLITAANLGVFAGIGMVGILIPVLVSLLGKDNLSNGYFFSVLLIMIISYMFMVFGHKIIKERVEPAKSEKPSLKEVFKALAANNHLFKMLGIFFLNVFMNIVNGIVIYFFIYNMRNESLMTIFGFVGTASAAGFFLIPALTKRFKKRTILFAIVSLDILVRIIFFMVGFSNAAMVMIFLGMTQFLHASAGPVMSTMIAETIEYSEVKTGKRCEAIVFSGQTFIGKLAAAISGSLIGILLTIIGYVPEAATQSPNTNKGLFIIISLLPIIGSVLRIIILSTYKYTEEDYKENLAILEKKRAEN